MKEYGQDLKRKLVSTRNKLANLHSKIIKRFDMIVSDHVRLLTDEEKNYIQRVGVNDLTIDKKLEIMIAVEDRYKKEHSNQANLFNE